MSRQSSGHAGCSTDLIACIHRRRVAPSPLSFDANARSAHTVAWNYVSDLGNISQIELTHSVYEKENDEGLLRPRDETAANAPWDQSTASPNTVAHHISYFLNGIKLQQVIHDSCTTRPLQQPHSGLP